MNVPENGLFYPNLEYSVVEDDHDKARDVEGAQGGPNDEVRVVECTDERLRWINKEIGSVFLRGI